jgi:tRNA(fMet)-specific endonuclease VapC
MSFLIDTNIGSAHIKRPGLLNHRFIQYMGRVAIPTIALAELRAGAYMLPDPSKLLLKIEDLLVFLEVLDFDDAAAEEFGKLRGVFHRQGFTVPTMDLLIASIALAHDLTLVTHNTADFVRIPGLRLEDWLIP